MATHSTKLYSIIFQKCPRCHQGNMFKSAPYSKRFMEMNNTCPTCNLDFVQEPSFYFGAMYLSYAFLLIIFTLIYFALRYTINPATSVYVWAMVVSTLAFVPLNFRWSRAAWINIFVRYQGNRSSAEQDRQ